MKKIIFLISISLLVSCGQEKEKNLFSREDLKEFKPESFELRNNNVKLVRGQILYMPIYSNIPHYSDSNKIDMSAFLAFHNTDLFNTIRIQKVQYFNTKGKLVHDFLPNDSKKIEPLETVNFYIPYQDQSGIGANFLIEWVSDSLVTEPLVESITINTIVHNSVAVLSQGKIIKEIK